MKNKSLFIRSIFSAFHNNWRQIMDRITMKTDQHKPSLSLDRLSDALSDTVLASSDDAILAEVREEDGSLDKLNRHYEQILERAIKTTNAGEPLSAPPCTRPQSKVTAIARCLIALSELLLYRKLPELRFPER